MSLNLKCSPTSSTDEKIINISNDKINVLEDNKVTGFLEILNMSWACNTTQILNIDLPKDTKFDFDPSVFLNSEGLKFIAVITSNKVKAEKSTENDKLTISMFGSTTKTLPLGRLFILTSTVENLITDTYSFYNGDYDSDNDTLSGATNDVTLKILVGV